MITRLGRTAYYCYSVIAVFKGCIPLFMWEEMAVEGGLVKGKKGSKMKSR